MNNLYQVFFIVLLFLTWSHSGASERHKHQQKKTDDSGHSHHDHDHEHDQNHQETDQKQHEDEHEDGHEKSQSKTILEIKGEGRKFKLSKKAIETLKLKYSPCQYASKGDLKIQKSSLVKYGNKFGIFLHKIDWFELVEVKIVASGDVENLVTPFKNITSGPCEVVTSGVPLLRVAQLEASGEGGKGHAH